MSNQIFIITLYYSMSSLVYKDHSVGLVRGPFFSGVPDSIDAFVDEIPNAREGFRLLFSVGPCPGYQEKLKLVREERGEKVTGVSE